MRTSAFHYCGYRLLKAHDLITSPAFVLLKAADQFAKATTAPNQLWQTDFTYLKVIGWGWFELWRVHYNTIRPHSSLGYRPPAPQTFAPLLSHLDGTTAMQ